MSPADVDDVVAVDDDDAAADGDEDYDADDEDDDGDYHHLKHRITPLATILKMLMIAMKRVCLPRRDASE